MTDVLSIDRIGGSASDVSVHQLDQSTLELQDTITDIKAGTVISTYTLPTGDRNYPTNVTVRTQQSPRDPNVALRASITLSSWARIVDGDGVVVGLKPASAVTAFNLPGIAVELDDISMLLANNFGLTFDILTSKVRSTALLGKLLFGLTKLY